MTDVQLDLLIEVITHCAGAVAFFLGLIAGATLWR